MCTWCYNGSAAESQPALGFDEAHSFGSNLEGVSASQTAGAGGPALDITSHGPTRREPPLQYPRPSREDRALPPKVLVLVLGFEKAGHNTSSFGCRHQLWRWFSHKLEVQDHGAGVGKAAKAGDVDAKGSATTVQLPERVPISRAAGMGAAVQNAGLRCVTPGAATSRHDILYSHPSRHSDFLDRDDRSVAPASDS